MGFASAQPILQVGYIFLIWNNYQRRPRPSSHIPRQTAPGPNVTPALKRFERLDENRPGTGYWTDWKRAMLEIGIFGFIFLAAGYWAVLWTMGRRADVLHGEFVEGGAPPDEPVRATAAKPSVRPIFSEPPLQAATQVPPAKVALARPPAFRPERMELLLNSIKQDLDRLVQK